jgi:hypothetical protein
MLSLVDAADGIAFGTPTYMGGPSAQFKASADATSDRWSEQRWSNKVAAGFTTGSCANGDQGNTLTYFAVLAAQHGMVWCGLDIPGGCDPLGRNRLGSQLGLATCAIEGIVDVPTSQPLATWATAWPAPRACSVRPQCRDDASLLVQVNEKVDSWKKSPQTICHEAHPVSPLWRA